MKPFFLFLLLVLAATVRAEEKPTPAAAAVTNADAAAAKTLGELKSPIVITSRSSVVNLRSNVVVYFGNVRVTETNMSLLCEYLIAVMPQRGGRIESILAQTNVVMDMTDEKGEKVHGTGEKLLYTYRATETETNEVIELSGNPWIETARGSTKADVITYDRITGMVRFQNPQMTIQQEGNITNFLSNPLLGTNAPKRKP